MEHCRGLGWTSTASRVQTIQSSALSCALNSKIYASGGKQRICAALEDPDSVELDALPVEVAAEALAEEASEEAVSDSAAVAVPVVVAPSLLTSKLRRSLEASFAHLLVDQPATDPEQSDEV